MKKQVWYKTNLGYLTTRRNIMKSKMFENCLSNKGRFSFNLKDYRDVTFQITSQKHKLCISYPEEIDYKIFFEKVLPFLLKADGSPIDKVEIITITNENRLKKKDEQPLFKPREAITLAYFKERGKEVRFYKNFVDDFIWIRRGAKPDEKPR